LWLNDRYCGETLFEGRQSDTRIFNIPMLEFSKIVSPPSESHVFQKAQKGSLTVPAIQAGGQSPRKGDEKSPRVGSARGDKSPRIGTREEKSPRKADKDKKKKEKKKGKDKEKEKEKDKEKDKEKAKEEEEIKEAKPDVKKEDQKPKIDKGDLMVQKEGKGRLYYRIAMSYAPSSLEIGAKSNGFEVTRTYTAEDKAHPENVTRDKDGIWHVKKGTKVHVTLTITNDLPRFNIAVVDKLAGGVEAENPDLKALSQSEVDKELAKVQELEKAKGGTILDKKTEIVPPWFDHQNMRDERVECFAQQLPAGSRVYSYVARATTPGKFVVPPCRTEEMYNPDIYGISSSNIVMIE